MLRNALFSFVTLTALGSWAVACSKPSPVGNSSPAGSAGSLTTQAAPVNDTLPALATFEGEIDVLMKTDKPPPDDSMTVPLLIKSGKVHVGMPESLSNRPGNPFGSAYAIFDAPAKKIDLVMDSRKQVVEIDLNKSGEALKGLTPPSRDSKSPQAPPGPPPTLTETGKYDTVAGYKCEYWDIVAKARTGTVCVAQVGSSWFSIPSTGIPTEHAWMAKLMDGEHLPLRFIGYAKDGVKEETRIEIAKLDRRALPATTFEYPPAYQVIGLDQMLRGLMMAGAMGMPGAPGVGGMGAPPFGMPMRHGPPPGLPHGTPGASAHPPPLPPH